MHCALPKTFPANTVKNGGRSARNAVTLFSHSVLGSHVVLNLLRFTTTKKYSVAHSKQKIIVPVIVDCSSVLSLLLALLLCLLIIQEVVDLIVLYKYSTR